MQIFKINEKFISAVADNLKKITTPIVTLWLDADISPSSIRLLAEILKNHPSLKQVVINSAIAIEAESLYILAKALEENPYITEFQCQCNGNPIEAPEFNTFIQQILNRNKKLERFFALKKEQENPGVLEAWRSTFSSHDPVFTEFKNLPLDEREFLIFAGHYQLNKSRKDIIKASLIGYSISEWIGSKTLIFRNVISADAMAYLIRSNNSNIIILTKDFNIQNSKKVTNAIRTNTTLETLYTYDLDFSDPTHLKYFTEAVTFSPSLKHVYLSFTSSLEVNEVTSLITEIPSKNPRLTSFECYVNGTTLNNDQMNQSLERNSRLQGFFSSNASEINAVFDQLGPTDQTFLLENRYYNPDYSPDDDVSQVMDQGLPMKPIKNPYTEVS